MQYMQHFGMKMDGIDEMGGLGIMKTDGWVNEKMKGGKDERKNLK